MRELARVASQGISEKQVFVKRFQKVRKMTKVTVKNYYVTLFAFQNGFDVLNNKFRLKIVQIMSF